MLLKDFLGRDIQIVERIDGKEEDDWEWGNPVDYRLASGTDLDDYELVWTGDGNYRQEYEDGKYYLVKTPRYVVGDKFYLTITTPLELKYKEKIGEVRFRISHLEGMLRVLQQSGVWGKKIDKRIEGKLNAYIREEGFCWYTKYDQKLLRFNLNKVEFEIRIYHCDTTEDEWKYIEERFTSNISSLYEDMERLNNELKNLSDLTAINDYVISTLEAAKKIVPSPSELFRGAFPLLCK